MPASGEGVTFHTNEIYEGIIGVTKGTLDLGEFLRVIDGDIINERYSILYQALRDNWKNRICYENIRFRPIGQTTISHKVVDVTICTIDVGCPNRNHPISDQLLPTN